MLTILEPDIVPVIQQMPGGVLPLTLMLTDEEYPAFIVKAPKEYILSAKINKNFKVYLLPVTVENQTTLGLVTAFFDDEDEPLVIRTPLFLDNFSKDLFRLLRNRWINVHFFDELSRELLVYRAGVVIPDETQKKIDELILLDFSYSKASAIVEGIGRAFSLRTSVDDDQSIDILLSESVFGEEIFRQDIHPRRHSYHGSRGFSHTLLEREEPGGYQEEDIIQCLLLVFQPEQIYFSPKRIYDNEEVCDILVVTENNSLIIQAKDSPNIERISRQKLLRKRKNVLHSLKKATEQVKGALSYYRRISGRLDFRIDEELYSLDTKSLEINTLIVVKELFYDDADEFTTLLLDVYKNKDAPCVAFSYIDFYLFCFHLNSEKAFFNGYKNMMTYAAQNGVYPSFSFESKVKSKDRHIFSDYHP